MSWQTVTARSAFQVRPIFTKLNGETTPTICWTGDGGTYDIGIATLSAAAERNEDMMYFCYDNEIYGNTGGQRSGAMPPLRPEA